MLGEEGGDGEGARGRGKETTSAVNCVNTFAHPKRGKEKVL